MLFPLEEGTVLEYERGTQVEFTLFYVLAGYERYSVHGDTTIDTTPYQVVSVEHYAPDYALVERERCGVRVAETAPFIRWVPASADDVCAAPAFTSSPDLRTLSPELEERYVGRRPADLLLADTVRWGVGGVHRYTFAENVGLLSWEWDASTDSERLNLVHAETTTDTLGRPFDSDDWKAFYTLAEGDVREYRYVDTDRFGGSELDEVWYAHRDTTIGGLRHRLVQTVTRGQTRSFGDTTDVRTDALCALRLAPSEGRARWTHVRGDGRCPDPSADLRPTWNTSRLSMRDRAYTIHLAEAEGGNTGDLRTYAEDIGPVSHEWYDYNGPCCGYSWSRRLVYAEIDGVAVDFEEPDPSDEPDPSAAFVVGRPFPNPATGAAYVAITLPPEAEAEVAIFDMLGRPVRRFVMPGSHDAALVDLEGLPAGIYALRFSLGRGNVAVHLITKAE